MLVFHLYRGFAPEIFVKAAVLAAFFVFGGTLRAICPPPVKTQTLPEKKNRVSGQPNMSDSEYQDGLREGRLRALEESEANHGRRLDMHERRLTAQERITYALLGAIALVQILPVLKDLLR